MSDKLQQRLGIAFDDERLLQSALIHRSFFNEHPERLPGLTSNERLEFLGDAVLNFLTASWLFERFPLENEGELTKLRAALVKTATLARFARSLELGSFVRISRGEDSAEARNREPLLADVFEAVLGAVYVDQGIAAAQAFVLPFLETGLADVQQGNVDSDYRTRLQEYVQAQHSETPVYHTVNIDGPEHRREYTLEVLVQGQPLGQGTGSSKQAAAQRAAQAALQALIAQRIAATNAPDVRIEDA